MNQVIVISVTLFMRSRICQIGCFGIKMWLNPQSGSLLEPSKEQACVRVCLCMQRRRCSVPCT